MTVINLPPSSGHKPAPATYHAPLVHFPPYNPEFDFDFDEDDDEDEPFDEPSQPTTKPKSKPVSITIVPSMKPKRTRSRTRATQSQPSSPRPSGGFSGFTTMQRRDTAPGRPSLHARGASVSSSTMSSPELSTASSSPSSLPKGYFSSLHGRPQAQRQPSYTFKG